MENREDRRERICGKVAGGLMCCDGVREDFHHKDKVGNLIKCRFWTHLYGKDPQTEQTIDQFDCSEAWLPVTTVENSQMTRQAAASIDKMRNIFAGLVRPANAARLEEDEAEQLPNGNGQ